MQTFAVFTKHSENDVINYPKGFKTLVLRYDSINKSHYAGKKDTNELLSVFNKVNSNLYIEFRLRSQVVTEKNGDIWVVFPKIKDSKVTALVICALSKDGTLVTYKNIGPGNELFNVNIKGFQDAFLKMQVNPTSFSKSIYNPNGYAVEECRPSFDCTGEIEEVIITVLLPQGPGTDSDLYLPNDFLGGDPGVIGGDCYTFDGCAGGGGGGSSPQPSANQKIIDNLEGYPCAQETLKQLPSLNNDLFKLLQGTFGTNDNLNITFNAKEGMGTVDGERSYAKYEDGNFNATIDLNSDVLRNATKEFTLVTMYHEAIHAYLGYQAAHQYDQYISKFPKVIEYQVKNSNGETITRYCLDSTHQNYGPFIDSMKNAIMSFNPKISNELALALAKYGVVTDLTQNEYILNQNERDTNSNNYQGTKCP